MSHTNFTPHIPPSRHVPKADQTCSFGCRVVFFHLPTHHLSSHHHLVHETHRPPPTTFLHTHHCCQPPTHTLPRANDNTNNMSMPRHHPQPVHGDDNVAHQWTCHIAQMVMMCTIITIHSRKLSSPLPSPIPSFTPNAGATSLLARRQVYMATHEQQFAHPKTVPPHPLVMTPPTDNAYHLDTTHTTYKRCRLPTKQCT